MDKYYITTPIYYPSAGLHVGHTYCTVMADAMARYKRLCGFDVMFLTGTDEHGQKIQKIATEKGKSPQAYVDDIVAGIKELWKTMEISYDDFIRTTEDRHKLRVQELFKRLDEAGDIYKGVYEGWYCTPCESFWTDVQLKDGKCPDCGREVERAKEDAYFFKLSKYADDILKLYEEHPEFLEPEARRNEMRAFIQQGLEDLCISRSSFDWGIQVPIDEGQVIYVWLDALTNYITALGYPNIGSDGITDEKYKRYWPCDVHLVGKEIVRFHAIIWPAMLMSMKLPLPKKVLGHGWLLLGGGKISKSKESTEKKNVVDPKLLIERYGVDALKYFLLREYTFGSDGTFNNEVMLTRINSDLANDLGNLVSRVVSMVLKYQDGKVSKPSFSASESDGEIDKDLEQIAISRTALVDQNMEKFAFNLALEAVWELISKANKYIDLTKPWVLGKDEASAERLNAVLYNLAEAIRIISVLIYPFMENTSRKISRQLGLSGEPTWSEADIFGLKDVYTIEKGEGLFPRIDISEELIALASVAESIEKAEEKKVMEEKPLIKYEDFAKLDLRVGEIISAIRVPKSKKLLMFKIKVGDEERQILSGVAEYFLPGDCIGKRVIIVANLEPRMMMGLESKGMILFADDKDKFAWVLTETDSGEAVT